MPYIVPTFNLTVNIWRATHFPLTNPFDLQVTAQLKAPKADMSEVQYQPSAVWFNAWFLLLTKRTDIRDGGYAGRGDWVECPAGTGRYYDVLLVDDVARGFLNEYRIAFLRKSTTGGLAWPAPIP